MRSKIQKRIYFNNNCGCIVDYLELEKAIIWYSEYPTHSKKNIYMYGSYPAVTVCGRKIHVHRLLCLYWNNIKDADLYAHHKNENKLDASIGNIVFMEKTMHQSKHNINNIISPEQKEAIIKHNKTTKGKSMPKRIDLCSDEINKLYRSGICINQIAKLLNASWSTIKYRVIKTPSK